VKTWVIGGLSGIGAAVADRLRTQHNADNGMGKPDLSLKLTGLDVDVSDMELVREFIGRNKPINELVYCAGIQKMGFLGDDIIEDVADVFLINTLGFIHVMDVLRSEQGTHPLSVVAVVSDASRVPMRGSIAYCASKAALHQAVRVAARETAPTWRVNGVSPGIVADTPLTDGVDADVRKLRGWTAEQAAAYEASLIPMGRRARKEEVARVIVDVLRGPMYMTGSIVEITGGK
jgi:2,3-dihydro-2,3-dihydroxybenzoate dehydrogenase